MEKLVYSANAITNYPIVEIVVYIGIIGLAGYVFYALWKKLKSL